MNHLNQKAATVAVATGSLVTCVGVGLACVGPLLGIVFGIGGLGFLTRYQSLQLPATIATGALVAVGFFLAYRRPKESRTQVCSERKRRGLSAWSRVALWTATLFAVAIHVFEYFIFPGL